MLHICPKLRREGCWIEERYMYDSNSIEYERRDDIEEYRTMKIIRGRSC